MTTSPRYTHILFDADNTLFDFDETARRALLQLFDSLSVEPTDENFALFHRINQSWWVRIEKGEVTYDQLIAGRMLDFFAAANLPGDAIAASQRMVDYLSQHSIVLDGAEELLRALAPHCRLFIITNGLSRVQHSRFDPSPLRQYVERLYISGEIGAMKPSREYFDHVLADIGEVDRRKILVVGDSLSSDMRGGINAELDTCWYNPLNKSAGDLSPTYTVSSLAEVEDIIMNG